MSVLIAFARGYVIALLVAIAVGGALGLLTFLVLRRIDCVNFPRARARRRK